MTMDPIKTKEHFLCWREWEPNPILVKELRQAVRSRILEGLMMILLLMLLAGSIAALLGESVRTGVVEMGRAVFCSCLTMLAVGGLICLPLYTGIRLALEIHQTDLMLFTPQRVQNLVLGKALSGMYLAGLLLSVCLPFMAFSSLLRGLDVFTILFTLWLLFAAILVAILASVAIGAVKVHVVGKVVLVGALAGGLVVFCLLMLLFLFDIVQTGIQPLLVNADFQFKVYFFFVAMFVGSMIAYGTALSFIAKEPRQKNPEDNHAYSIA